MKNSKRRIKAFFAAAIMMTCILVSNAIPSFAASTGYFNTWKTEHIISDRYDGSSMQGMAVGDTFFYTAKINSNGSKAYLYKTHRTNGKTVLIKNGKNNAFYNLGHANDMDVIGLTINKVRKSHIFVATMKKGQDSLVRLTVKGSESTAQVVAKYRLTYSGKNIAASGVAVMNETSKNITLLIKSNVYCYKAVIPRNDDKAFGYGEISKEIKLTHRFTIDVQNVKINGKTYNLSQYLHQGCDYHNGKIYVPLTGNKGYNDGKSVILVYAFPTILKPGSIKNNSKLSFSFYWPGMFEIESCGINAKTGYLYFNTNRREGDGIHRVKGYTFY